MIAGFVYAGSTGGKSTFAGGPRRFGILYCAMLMTPSGWGPVNFILVSLTVGGPHAADSRVDRLGLNDASPHRELYLVLCRVFFFLGPCGVLSCGHRALVVPQLGP